MDLLGFLFIIFFFTTIYLMIKYKAIQDENKWLYKDREKFCDTTYTEENGYMVLETKLKDNIKILDNEGE